MSFLIALGKTMLLDQNQIYHLELFSVDHCVTHKLAEQSLVYQP